MTRRRVVGVALVVAAGAALWLGVARRDEFALPAQLTFDDVVATFAAADGSPAPATGWLQPSHDFDAAGGYREAVLAPPPSTFTWRVQPPADAALELAFAVEGTGRRDRHAAGIRFVVRIDGHEALSRVVNPAADRHDRHWMEAHLALPATDRPVELTFATEAAGRGATLAGSAGWADLRIVRERHVARQTASVAAPNVVMVVVDTLRADRLGCYGATPSPSPTLDALAARGRLFEHMTAQASWTLPATATLMTGLLPRQHRLEGWGAGALSDGLTTLAEQAAVAGVTTVGVSANPLVSRRTNFAQGFETFRDYAWDPKRRNWAGAADVTGPFVRWLARNHGHRFLAYLQLMEPHDPYTPPPPYRPPVPDGVRPSLRDGYLDGMTPRNGDPKSGPLTDVELAYLRARYDGEVHAWDDALAHVLAALDASGVAQSTVVVITADHGEEFREHGRLKHGWHLYDETLHVPLVVAGPSIAPGRVATPVQGIDVFPTVAALLGVGVPAGLEGRNVLANVEERPVFSETHHGIAPDGSDMRIDSLRTSAWKLIHTPLLDRWELYDLARDPGERDDRFATAPEAAALRETLARWEADAPPPPATSAPDPALRQRLKALGYVE